MSFFNNLKLKRRFVRQENETGGDLLEEKINKYIKTKELLPEADLENIVPPSVTERTTRKLRNKR